MPTRRKRKKGKKTGEVPFPKTQILGLVHYAQDLFLRLFQGVVMEKHIIMDEKAIARTLTRLAHEISEKEGDLSNVVLVGIRKGGEYVAARVSESLLSCVGEKTEYAGIDITLKRDDLVSAFFVPEYTENKLPFSIDGKTVVLCDDVLHTGRTVRAAIETLFTLGRPKKVLLLELIDRGGRQLPIRADFVGKNVPTSKSEHVEVFFKEEGAKEDKILIVKK